MPKFTTLPTLYDNCKQLSIFDLKRWEYLTPNQYRTGIVSWNRNGTKTGNISIRVITESESGTIELDYKCNETPIKYKVNLTSTPSNLGKGVVWYFICPHTGKRCRKLYLADTYFYHRTAFRGCMYEKQTYSHKTRNLFKTFGKVFETEQLYEQLYKKHFKRQYAGKPTKKYLKLTQQIQRAESIPLHEIERAMLS